MVPHPLNRITYLIYRPSRIYELRERKLAVVVEQVVPLRYKNLTFDSVYRIDLRVENEVIVEVK